MCSGTNYYINLCSGRDSCKKQQSWRQSTWRYHTASIVCFVCSIIFLAQLSTVGACLYTFSPLSPLFVFHMSNLFSYFLRCVVVLLFQPINKNRSWVSGSSV